MPRKVCLAQVAGQRSGPANMRNRRGRTPQTGQPGQSGRIGTCGLPGRFSQRGVPAGTPPGHGPSAPPNRAKPANRCGARIAGATASLPLTSFLTSSYDLRNWKAIGKARRHVPDCHDSRAKRLRTGTAPRQTSTSIAARKPDDTPRDTGENARLRDSATTQLRQPWQPRRITKHRDHAAPRAPARNAHRQAKAARTVLPHDATGTTPRTRKHERNTVLLAASRIHGHCALPGRDFISTTIRNKGDGLCPRRWRPKEPMLS